MHRSIGNAHVILDSNQPKLDTNQEPKGAMRPRNGMKEFGMLIIRSSTDYTPIGNHDLKRSARLGEQTKDVATPFNTVSIDHTTNRQVVKFGKHLRREAQG